MDTNPKTFLVILGPLRVLVQGATSTAAALEAVNRLPGVVAETDPSQTLRERLAGTLCITLPPDRYAQDV